MSRSALWPRAFWPVLALLVFLPLTCPQQCAAQSTDSDAKLSETKSLATAGDAKAQFRLGMAY